MRQGLTKYLWLSWNYADQAILKHCFKSSGMKGMCHHALLNFSFSKSLRLDKLSLETTPGGSGSKL